MLSLCSFSVVACDLKVGSGCLVDNKSDKLMVVEAPVDYHCLVLGAIIYLLFPHMQ